MNTPTEDCAAFFKGRPAYHRILELLLRKYRSFGRPAGTICLADATLEECNAARDLFGHTFPRRFVSKRQILKPRSRIPRIRALF